MDCAQNKSSGEIDKFGLSDSIIQKNENSTTLITYRQNLNKNLKQSSVELILGSDNLLGVNDTASENMEKEPSDCTLNYRNDETNLPNNDPIFSTTLDSLECGVHTNEMQNFVSVVYNVEIDVPTDTPQSQNQPQQNYKIRNFTAEEERTSNTVERISSTNNANDINYHLNSRQIVAISPNHYYESDRRRLMNEVEKSPSEIPDSSNRKSQQQTADFPHNFLASFAGKHNSVNNFLFSGFNQQAANFAFSGHNLWKNLQQINKEASGDLVYPAKIKCTQAREAVDPAKYFTLTGEPDGVKYACSKCGNVYKWRKSLNKHWKEKHEGERPPNQTDREQMLRTQPQFAAKPIIRLNVNNVCPQYPRTSQLQTMSFNSASLPWTTSDGRSILLKNMNVELRRAATIEEAIALDLTIKEDSSPSLADCQQFPLDFSKKSTHAETISSPPKQQQRRVGGSQTTRCMQCLLYFSTVADLNKHFSMHHMDKMLDLLGQPKRDEISSRACFVCGLDSFSTNQLDAHLIEMHSIDVQTNKRHSLHSTNTINSDSTPAFSNAMHWLGYKTKDTSRYLLADPSNQLNRDFMTDISSNLELNSSLISDLSKDGIAYVLPEAPEETILRQNIATKSGKSKKEIMSNLPEHMLPFKCRLCMYRARWPSEMTQHMKNHSDEKPYQCPQCQYRSKWKWDVVKHLKRCGGKEELRRRKFNFYHFPSLNSKKSDYCGAESESSLSKTEADAVREQTGVESGKRGSDDETINSTSVDNTHECVLCSFKGHSPAELKRHLKVHCDEKPYSCKTCRYSSKWKCDLKKHIRAYNHSPVYPLIYRSQTRKSYTPMKQSPDCDYTSEYMYEQTDEGRLKCAICAFEAQEVTAVIQHWHSHNETEDSHTNKYSNTEMETDARKSLNYFPEEADSTKGDLFLKNLGLERKCDSDVLPENLIVVKKCTFPILKFRRGRQGLTTTEGAEEGLSKRKRKLRNCLKCGYVTDNLTTLQRHLAKHGGAGRHSCQLCDYTVDRQHVLDYHIDIAHDRRKDRFQHFSCFSSQDSENNSQIVDADSNNDLVDSLNLDSCINNLNGLDKLIEPKCSQYSVDDSKCNYRSNSGSLSSNSYEENTFQIDNKSNFFAKVNYQKKNIDNSYVKNTVEDMTDYNCNSLCRKGGKLKKKKVPTATLL